MNLEYKVIDSSLCDIFSKPSITELTLALAKENCEVLSVNEHDESLESYYISLIGGAEND